MPMRDSGKNIGGKMWVFVFLLGTAIGSFLNVCIYRIPRDCLSIHSPLRSFCPECGETIKSLDTIPILSYLFLRGRCRHCNTDISLLYPCVELVTALLFLATYVRFGVSLESLLALVFISLLVPIAVIDAQHYIIPNVLIGTGLILGFGIVCGITFQRADIWYLLTRVIGTLAGGTMLWLIAVIGSAVLRKKAMGGGDIKLMTLNGLFLGAWPELAMVIAFSAFSGAIVGTVLIIYGIKSRQSPIPYGPFLAGAAVLVLLCGDSLWQTYLQLVGWH